MKLKMQIKSDYLFLRAYTMKYSLINKTNYIQFELLTFFMQCLNSVNSLRQLSFFKLSVLLTMHFAYAEDFLIQ